MAWARTQGFGNSATGPQATVAATLGSAVATGNTILVITQANGDPASLNPTLTDSLGNTYNRLTSGQGGQQFFAGTGQGADGWWCIVTAAGTPTITYTPNSGGADQDFIALKGDHFTGSDAASTRRASAGATQDNPGTGANAITTASVAAQANDLHWAGVIEVDGGTTTHVAGTGFTGTGSPDQFQTLTEWLTAGGAAAATATDATNGATGGYLTISIAITPSATGTSDDVLVRYGSLSLVDGSGLVTAFFETEAAGAAPGGGNLLDYWRRIVQECD